MYYYRILTSPKTPCDGDATRAHILWRHEWDLATLVSAGGRFQQAMRGRETDVFGEIDCEDR